MAKKQTATKKGAVKPDTSSDSMNTKLAAAVVLVLTLITFFPTLKADFVNWDDPNYVLGNKMITELSWKNIKEMFTTFCMGNYHPITIFTYAIEFSFVGLKPYLYHFDNLLLHLGSTGLLFYFVYQLTGKQTFVAAITAVLFGVHPMHVESVAWVSERKDVLYVFFMLASLYAYLQYFRSNFHKKYYGYALLFFLLSLLSKAQAVVLAPVLVLLDYYLKRKFNTKVMLEKVPFFLLALLFGVIAIIAQKEAGAVNQVKIELYKSLFIGNYGLLVYLYKSVLPIQMAALHPYPFSGSEPLPMTFYIAPLLIIALAIWVFVKFKNDVPVIFGLSFFVLTIFPVLQFLPVGEAIIAERYTYVPYIGLFFLMGHFVANAESYNLIRKSKSMLQGAIILFVLVMFIAGFQRSKVWVGSIELWTDAIEKYPNSRTAYNNRGYMYNQIGTYDVALQDLNKGISIDSTYSKLYMNRGVSYGKKLMWDEAVKNYNACVRFDAKEDKAYMNRGIIFTDHLPNYSQAIKDFEMVLKLTPDNFDARVNLGIAHYKVGKPAKAIEVLDKATEINPKANNVYYLKAMSFDAMGKPNEALENAKLAVENGYVLQPGMMQLLEQKVAAKK